MITNKSTSIRLGSFRGWSTNFSSLDSNYYGTSINFYSFIDSFFSDSIFRERGVAYSHANIKFSGDSIKIQNFFQDAKILDFINTYPRRPIFSSASRISRFNKYWQPTYRRSPAFNKYFFKKKYLFRRPNRRIFTFRFRSLLLRRVFYSLYSLKFARIKKSKRYGRFRKTYFTNYLNFFFSKHSFRLRYHIFLVRLLSSFASFSFNRPVRFKFNHVLPRYATPDLYLNYICAKLYYRYILNDVINPIVRVSLRYYRGFSISCKGRFTRAQMASQKNYRRGGLSFGYLGSQLSYSQKSVTLKYGTCNLKLWIRR